MSNLILEALSKALNEGEATLNLKEASALTGSGSGVGGRVIYGDSFAPLRYENPLRKFARISTVSSSDYAFTAKTGNATLVQSGGTDNPWGYGVNSNVGDYSTAFWQLPVRAINATVPVREAVLSDVNYLNESIMSDMYAELSQQEGLSMMLNNDQSGSTTYNYGATAGLRGLNQYTGSTSSASFGTTGSAITNGLHTVLQVTQASSSAVSYDDLANLFASLPSQYLYRETTAWVMHPATIQALRKLKGSTGGAPMFVEAGDDDGGAVIYIFGHRVIPNPYMSVAGSGNYSVYFGDWYEFLEIADSENITIKLLEQTQPGFITYFCEKRVCSSIRNVFAGVRLVG